MTIFRQWRGFVPVAASVLVVAGVSHLFADTHPASGPHDVDVLVLEASAKRPDAEGKAPRGGLDAAAVDDSSFTFTGWADVTTGASFVLVTRGVSLSPGSRIRIRSQLRQDVVSTYDAPKLLYSGYTFGGSVHDWGSPRCLYLRADAGT